MSAREVALDTNVFLLYLVGMVDKGSIQKSKRLAAIDEEAFERLVDLISGFDQIVVTPGCLSETTNLLDYDKARRAGNFMYLAELFGASDALDERYVPAKQAVKEPSYMWLGITDATYVEIAKRGIPVVTADLRLFLQVVGYAPESVNFTSFALD